MKVISRDDLNLVLDAIGIETDYKLTLGTFEQILDKYGDEWFMDTKKWEFTNPSKEMTKLRNEQANRR